MLRKSATIIFVFLFIVAKGQNYPKGYFRNPLDIPIFLAGNFGECRPNHFHSGLDIKTNGKENQAVHAAADGYISRIKMEPGGFGHALYVTHPNGYTTLYAHLNDFIQDVQRYVHNEQYKNESWTVDLQLNASQFPVKKGQQIAWSGNTGSSTAPHLHFEIRDNKTEHPLNPMLFGFDITDNLPPVIQRLAIYNLSGSIYEQTPQIVAIKKNGVIPDTIVTNSSRIGIGLQTDDYMNGSENTLTFYKATVTLDNKLYGTITLDDIGYDVTRYQHAYIDYKSKKQNGSLIQLMFQLNGNLLDNIYNWEQKNKGVINIADRMAHHVEITLQDALNNSTSVAFNIRAGVDSVLTSGASKFKANQPNSFELPNVIVKLNEKALYDDICFSYATTVDPTALSNRHRIHYNYVPVHTYFDLSIKPSRAIAFNMKDKVALVYNDGKEETGKAASADGIWYKASVRNFGEYRLVLDTVPPEIKTSLIF
jgi:hypothetical protein